jgi:hypothetical protein
MFIDERRCHIGPFPLSTRNDDAAIIDHRPLKFAASGRGSRRSLRRERYNTDSNPVVAFIGNATRLQL